jgi:hypothetical protein
MKRDHKPMRLVLSIAAVVTALAAGAGCGPSSTGLADTREDMGAASTWSSDIPSTVPLAPDPGPGVSSFSYSAVQQVSHTSHATLKVGCPAGFYVRPGSGDIWGDNTPEPVIKTFVGNTVLMQQTQGAQLLYQYSGTPAGVALYQGVEEGYWNAGTSTHHFTITFWCDRLANVDVIAGARKKQAATPAAPRSKTSASADPSPTVGGDNSAFDAPLQNGATGEYLSGGDAGDTAQMSSAPTTMYVAGDQEGNPNDVYNAFAYGLWSEAGGNQWVGPNLGFDGDTATWFGPGSGIANGGLLLPVYANAAESAMLVQSESITVPNKGNVNDKTVGPGGQCLTAPAGGGGTPVLEACDATNPNQYWNFNSP